MIELHLYCKAAVVELLILVLYQLMQRLHFFVEHIYIKRGFKLFFWSRREAIIVARVCEEGADNFMRRVKVVCDFKVGQVHRIDVFRIPFGVKRAGIKGKQSFDPVDEEAERQTSWQLPILCLLHLVALVRSSADKKIRKFLRQDVAWLGFDRAAVDDALQII